MTESKRYLRELRAALPRPLRRRVVSEFRTHLRDGIAAETARGLSPDAAERITIERLGAPERVAAQFAADAPGTRDRTRVVVAAVAVLVALAIGASAVVTHTQHAKQTPTPTTATFARPRISTVPQSLVVLVQQITAKQIHARANGTTVVPRVVWVQSH